MAEFNIGYSVSDMVEKISDTPSALKMCLDFSDVLNTQGIFEWFLRGDKLDEFATFVESLEIMTGEFERVRYRKEFLRRNYDSHIIRQIASNMCTLRENDDLELGSKIEMLLDLWKTPKHSPSLFLVVCDFAVKLRRVYETAIDIYFREKVREGLTVVPKGGDTKSIDKFWQELTNNKDKIQNTLQNAFPLGIEDISGSEEWINSHNDVYMCIDFGQALSMTDFENAFHAFYGEKKSSAALMSKEDVNKEVEKIYKALLLNDVFGVLVGEDERVVSKINAVLQSMSLTQDVRMRLRYVQAFFMFFRVDAHRAKKMVEQLKKSEKYGVPACGARKTQIFPS